MDFSRELDALLTKGKEAGVALDTMMDELQMAKDGLEAERNGEEDDG